MTAGNNGNNRPPGTDVRSRRVHREKPVVDQGPPSSEPSEDDILTMLSPWRSKDIAENFIDRHFYQLSLDDILQGGTAMIENGVKAAWDSAVDTVSGPSRTPSVPRDPVASRNGRGSGNGGSSVA